MILQKIIYLPGDGWPVLRAIRCGGYTSWSLTFGENPRLTVLISRDQVKHLFESVKQWRQRHQATGVRDPEFPCAGYREGVAAGTCESDGHYLCRLCAERR